MPAPKKRHTLFFVIFIFIALFFFSSFVIDADEGVPLYNAWQFWNGNFRIYTEHFIDYLSPGTGLTVFYTWKLLGEPKYLYAFFDFFIFWSLGAFAIFKICEKYITNNAVKLTALLCWMLMFKFVSHINHSSFSMVPALFIIYMLTDRKGSIGKIISTGILTGLTAWYLQTRGIAVFASVLYLMIVYKNKIKEIIIYVFTSIAAATVLFSITGLVKTLESVFLLPFTTDYLTVNGNKLMEPYLFAAIAILITMYFVIRNFRKVHYYTLFIFQLAFYLSAFTNFNRSHFLINSVPVILFFSIILSEKILSDKVRLFTINLFFIIIAVLYTASAISVNVNGKNVFNTAAPALFEKNNVRRAKNIYAGPYLPVFYYFSGKTTAYPLSHTDVSNREAIDSTFNKIISIRPELAFINYSVVSNLKLNRNNKIDDYFRKKYIYCGNKLSETEIYAIDKSFCP